LELASSAFRDHLSLDKGTTTLVGLCMFGKHAIRVAHSPVLADSATLFAVS